jgi:Family of unknown function (DUF6338)
MEIDKVNDLFPILLFLLPGFVSVGVIEVLCVKNPKDVFGRVVEALIFTMLNLAGFLACRALLEKIPRVKFDHAQFITPGNVSLMALCAAVIGVTVAAEINNGWLLGVLNNRFHLTRKTSMPSTWNETWSHARKFVVVHLDDGRRIYGWPTFYSDSPEERALFLEDASWLDDDNRLINEAAPISVLLDKHTGIKLVEFLEPDATHQNRPND